MSRYFEALKSAMNMLAEQSNTLFVGQAVKYPGTAMHRTLEGIDESKLLEFPVAEDMQLGFCTGMSLMGHLPVCIYPRWNFVLLAANQLVNHLDKLAAYSDYRPKVIVRVGVPTPDPLNPGPQHLGDFSAAFRAMMLYTPVVELRRPEHIIPAYLMALESKGSCVLVEYTELYEEKDDDHPARGKQPEDHAERPAGGCGSSTRNPLPDPRGKRRKRPAESRRPARNGAKGNKSDHRKGGHR